jgi:hypothetical protein
MTDKMQSEINRGENTREREIAGKKGKESFELDRLGRGEIATNTLDRELGLPIVESGDRHTAPRGVSAPGSRTLRRGVRSVEFKGRVYTYVIYWGRVGSVGLGSGGRGHMYMTKVRATSKGKINVGGGHPEELGRGRHQVGRVGTPVLDVHPLFSSRPALPCEGEAAGGSQSPPLPSHNNTNHTEPNQR